MIVVGVGDDQVNENEIVNRIVYMCVDFLFKEYLEDLRCIIDDFCVFQFSVGVYVGFMFLGIIEIDIFQFVLFSDLFEIVCSFLRLCDLIKIYIIREMGNMIIGFKNFFIEWLGLLIVKVNFVVFFLIFK